MRLLNLKSANLTVGFGALSAKLLPLFFILALCELHKWVTDLRGCYTVSHKSAINLPRDTLFPLKVANPLLFRIYCVA